MFVISINGESAGIVDAVATEADMDVLKGLIDGKIEVYDLKSSGGTALEKAPTELNAFKFSVGKKDALNPASADRASVKIPHVKPTKSWTDMEPTIVGAFDASFDVATKCAYATLYYNRAEVA